MPPVHVRDMTPDDETFVGRCARLQSNPDQDACSVRRVEWLRAKHDAGVRAKVALLDDRPAGFAYVLPIELSPWGINFIYRDADKARTRKMLYIRGKGNKTGEWNTVQLQVDQTKDRFRVTINGKAVTGKQGEWAYFRYDRDAKAERAKLLGFSTADGWRTSRRFIDNITLTEADGEWLIPEE